MEWTGPAIVLDVAPFGEGDALATVMTEAAGAWRGLVRGGLSRRQAATWQPGNLIEARWIARLAAALGTLSAELVHPTAAIAMGDGLTLALLSAATATAAAALPERDPQPAAFGGLLRLLARLDATPASVLRLARFELLLLAGLGYGLDLDRCSLTGARDVAYVSPRTGRAVSAAAAGGWAERLLTLPPGLAGDPADDDDGGSTAEAGRDALRLTGHFLRRSLFAAQHRDIPAARAALETRLNQHLLD